MSHQVSPDLLRAEEEKRRRCADPVQQWLAFQATCTWLDNQQPIPRNSQAGCLAQQAKWAAKGFIPAGNHRLE